VARYPSDKGMDYEAIIRGGVIEFLRQLGLSWEERVAIYRAIPNFTADPPERPYLRTLGTHYLPIIREEFAPLRRPQ
jgi:hypothetical protein